MRPRETSYRLAYSPRDYQKCHRLLVDLGQPEPQLSWPTVMAFRGIQVVGCLSTQPSKQAIIAGPLAISTPRPIITAMRLIDAYEGILRHAGVTMYEFAIELDKNPQWLQVVSKFGVIPYYHDARVVWFRRELGV